MFTQCFLALKDRLLLDTQQFTRSSIQTLKKKKWHNIVLHCTGSLWTPGLMLHIQLSSNQYYIASDTLRQQSWIYTVGLFVANSKSSCFACKNLHLVPVKKWKRHESTTNLQRNHSYLRMALTHSTWGKCSRLLSTTAGDKKSHSCVCRSWSLSVRDFQYVLMRTGSVTYGDASSHGPTWLILSSRPSPHRWYHTANCNKIPKRLFFTVKHFVWSCHPVKAKYCALSLKRGQETGWSSIFGLCSLIKYSWGKV